MYIFNSITPICKILNLNSLYFRHKKPRQKLLFLLSMYGRFEDQTLHLDVILLKLHVHFFLDFSVILLVGGNSVYM